MAMNGRKTQNEIENTNVTQIQNDYVQKQTQKKKTTTAFRKKMRRRMTVILATGTLVLVPLCGNIIKNVTDIQSMDEKITIAKEEQKSVQEKNKELKTEIGLLQDKDYVAKLARSRYYLSKDGEIIFSLPEDNQSKAAE